jgi:hypothetical protein
VVKYSVKASASNAACIMGRFYLWAGVFTRVNSVWFCCCSWFVRVDPRLTLILPCRALLSVVRVKFPGRDSVIVDSAVRCACGSFFRACLLGLGGTLTEYNIRAPDF